MTELPRVHEEQLRAATERTHGILAQARAAHLGGRVVRTFSSVGGVGTKGNLLENNGNFGEEEDNNSSFALGFAAVVEEVRRRPELIVRCMERYPLSENERRSLARVFMYRVLSPLSTDAVRSTSELLKYANDRASPQCFEQLIKAYSGRSDLVTYFYTVWSPDVLRDAVSTACSQNNDQRSSMSVRIFVAAVACLRHLFKHLHTHKALENFPIPASTLYVESLTGEPILEKFILLPALKRCLRLARGRRLGKRRLADDLGRDFCLTPEEVSSRGDHIGLLVPSGRQDEDVSDDDLDFESDDDDQDEDQEEAFFFERILSSDTDFIQTNLRQNRRNGYIEDDYEVTEIVAARVNSNPTDESSSETLCTLVWQHLPYIFRCGYDFSLAQCLLSRLSDDRRRVRGCLEELTKLLQQFLRAVKDNSVSTPKKKPPPKARALCGCFFASRAECKLLASALLAVEAAIYLPRSHMAALKEAAESSSDDANCVIALRAPGHILFHGEDDVEIRRGNTAYERHANAIEPAWRDARRARALARRYLRRVVVDREEDKEETSSPYKDKRRRLPHGEFCPPSPETHRRREARKELEGRTKRQERSFRRSEDWILNNDEYNISSNRDEFAPKYSGSGRGGRRRGRRKSDPDDEFDDDNSFFAASSESHSMNQPTPTSDRTSEIKDTNHRNFDKVRLESGDGDAPTALPSSDQQLTNSTGSIKANDDDGASCISAATSRTGPTIIIQNSTVVIKKDEDSIPRHGSESNVKTKDDPTSFFDALLEKADGDTVTINGANFIFRSDGRDLSLIGQTLASNTDPPKVDQSNGIQSTLKDSSSDETKEEAKENIAILGVPPKIMISPPPAQTPEKPICIGGTANNTQEENIRIASVERAVALRQQNLGFVKDPQNNISQSYSQSYQRPPIHPRTPSLPSYPNSASSSPILSERLNRETTATPGTRHQVRNSSPTPLPRSRSTPPSSRTPLPNRPPHPHKRSSSPAPSDDGSAVSLPTSANTSRSKSLKFRPNSEANLLQRQSSFSRGLGDRTFSLAPDSDGSPTTTLQNPFSPARMNGGDEVAGLASLSPPGVRLVKHCRHSRPHGCYLGIDERGGTLCWTSRRRSASASTVSIEEIHDVRFGLSTAVLLRYGAADKAKRYFSVITEYRTLDFECPNENLRNNLVAAIDFLRKHNDL